MKSKTSARFTKLGTSGQEAKNQEKMKIKKKRQILE